MTKHEVLCHLQEEIWRTGSQAQWAREHQVSEQYLSDVLKLRREPGEKILDALGYRKVVLYEKAA